MGKTKIKKCKHHGRTEFAWRSDQRWRCRKCSSEAVHRRRRKVIDILINEAGGICIHCGYSKNRAALHFHHKDESTKKYNISASGKTIAIDKLRKETKKCDLICANCHAEEHHPHLNN